MSVSPRKLHLLSVFPLVFVKAEVCSILSVVNTDSV